MSPLGDFLDLSLTTHRHFIKFFQFYYFSAYHQLLDEILTKVLCDSGVSFRGCMVDGPNLVSVSVTSYQFRHHCSGNQHVALIKN